jgi:hypothetical protein
MQQWEYRVFVRQYVTSGGNTYTWAHDRKDKRGGQDLANDMGKEGWELAGLTTVPMGTTGDVHYIFKRPKQG